MTSHRATEKPPAGSGYWGALALAGTLQVIVLILSIPFPTTRVLSNLQLPAYAVSVWLVIRPFLPPIVRRRPELANGARRVSAIALGLVPSAIAFAALGDNGQRMLGWDAAGVLTLIGAVAAWLAPGSSPDTGQPAQQGSKREHRTA